MEIRILQKELLANAAGLARYVFDNCVKYRMEFPQSIRYVEEYLTAENLHKLYDEESLIVWGVYDKDQLVGVSGMTKTGMVTMLYILPQSFNKGFGRSLLHTMADYARENLELEHIRVNAMPAWAAMYFQKQGFYFVDKQQNMHVPHVPMYMETKARGIQKKYVPGKVIAGAIAGCFGFAAIVTLVFVISYLM